MKDIILIDLKLVDYGIEYESIFPLGLCYLTGALNKKTDYRTHSFHLTPEQLPDLLSFVRDKDPLFIGFCSTLPGSKIMPSLIFSRALKKAYPGIPIVWGGLLATICPDLCLKEDSVDIACIGDGEELIIDLAKAIESGANLDSVSGIVYKDKDSGLAFTEKREYIKDIDDFFPDFSFLNLDDYIFEHKGQGMLKYGFYPSRGCPFNCGFCYKSALHSVNIKQPSRFHSPEYCRELIRHVKSIADIGYTSFGDDNVSFDKDHFFDVLDTFIEEGVIPIHMQMKIDHLNENDIKRLGHYPIERINFGLESSLPRIQKLINKNLNIDKIKTNIGYFDKYTDFELRSCIIGGFPTQTREEMKEDIKETFSMAKWGSNLRIEYLLFTAYPRTALTRLAHQLGFEEPSSLEGWSKQSHIDVWFRPQPWLKWQTPKDLTEFYLIKKLISMALYYNIKSDKRGFFWNTTRYSLKIKFYIVKWMITHFVLIGVPMQHKALDLIGRLFNKVMLYEKASATELKIENINNG